jgi:hypothetical protein
MNLFVLFISAAFVAVGSFLVLTGRDPLMAWGTVIFFGGCLAVAAWDVIQTRGRALRMPVTFDPKDRFEPIVVKRSIGYFVVYFLGSACFACAGVLLIWSEKLPIIGWVAVVFFGLGAFVILVRAIDPRPRLIIDHDGIYDRFLGVGHILWQDIDGAYLRSIHGCDFVCLVVRDPSEYINRLPPMRRKLNKANLAIGFTELNVGVAGLKLTAEDLLRLIEERMRHQ